MYGAVLLQQTDSKDFDPELTYCWNENNGTQQQPSGRSVKSATAAASRLTGAVIMGSREQARRNPDTDVERKNGLQKGNGTK